MLTVDMRRDNQTEHYTDLNSIKEQITDPNSLFWVDVTDPTDDEWTEIANLFQFHPLAIEDARKRNQRPKLENYGDYLFLALRTWRGEKGPADDVNDATQEIEVFFAPNYIITIHDGTCDPLRELKRRWKMLKESEHRSAVFGKHEPPRTPILLLHTLLDTIVDALFPVMDKVDEAIDDIETKVYSAAAITSSQQEPLDLIPSLRFKKQLLLMRQTIAPLRDILNELLRTDDTLVPPEMGAYFQDVYDHTLRLLEQIDLHRDIVSGVMDAVVAQTSNRLNQVMKTLTVISTMLMSASLVAGIYGMNVKNLWLEDSPYTFNILMGLMIAIVIGLGLYFRKIKWI